MAPRIVRVGEHLDVIAYRHGVAAAQVWDHPGNAALKKARVGGHMLQAGDYLELPPRKHAEPSSVSVGGDSSFVADIPRVKIELVLAGAEGPLRGEPWHIEGRGERASGKTGADGKVSFEVRVTTPHVTLVLEAQGQRQQILVGGLDPKDSISGMIHRLNNLGYDAGPSASALDDRATRALVEFQKSKQLTPSGQPDEATIAALEAAHGS